MHTPSRKQRIPAVLLSKTLDNLPAVDYLTIDRSAILSCSQVEGTCLIQPFTVGRYEHKCARVQFRACTALQTAAQDSGKERQLNMGARQLIALVFGSVLLLATAPTRAGEQWYGLAVGADFVNFDPMLAVSLETGLWPDNKKFGYQAYLEYADPSCDDSMWTIGAEAIWRLKKFYGGIGLALSDERLCDRAGTKWNFSVGVGLRINKRFDVQWRHRSHGKDLGIRDGTPNDGVNLIQFRWRFKNAR